jgi:hypothetical protein
MQFIQALLAMDEGTLQRAAQPSLAKDSDRTASRIRSSTSWSGTKVCFEVIPAENTTVAPSNEPQFYNAFVDVVGVQDRIQLDQRSVLFLVPPKDPGVN